MNPYYSAPGVRIYHGSSLDVLRSLPENSVHCVVTSPPYWGLRDYGTAPQVWGGDPECVHEWQTERYYTEKTAGRSSIDAFSEPGQDNAERLKAGRWRQDDTCAKCCAWRGSLGLEPTPDLFVAHLVDIFRDVRRVLRADGTLWLNMGDSYAGEPRGNDVGLDKSTLSRSKGNLASVTSKAARKDFLAAGLKRKDLVGIPWMLAFALRADGWYLRSDVIWSKLNCMPEAVTDRPTKTHEYVFLLAKSPRYFYDAFSIRETSIDVEGGKRRYGYAFSGRPNLIMPDGNKQQTAMEGMREFSGTRNRRTVWTIASTPFQGAHFATFPPALVKPMVLAGTSAGGVCAECGAPYVRLIESTGHKNRRVPSCSPMPNKPTKTASRDWAPATVATTNWQPTCDHAGKTVPATVMDIFHGAGTTGMVAQQMGRHYIGIELKEDYIKLSLKRMRQPGMQL
jgi:DNA modification methylase